VSKSIIAPYALLPSGWERDVRFDIDRTGTITGITPASPTQSATLLAGPIIPGMPNTHSHAFQRAFAGRAERATSNDDSFWTWRSAMYDLANRITPDDLEAIAAQLYIEMVCAGYTSVCEFHYVHHAPGGRRYDDPAEMSLRLLAAADTAGIGMTLLPVFYHSSDFGGAPALLEQARFVHDVEGFMALFDALAPRCATSQRRLGIAPHSLRAVDAEHLQALIAALEERDPLAPIHIHIAEQQREVLASLATNGARPVEWLLANAHVDERWCLVHATHMTEEETAAVAQSGATVAICPTTEGNLGDGFFPLAAYLNDHGHLSIGSDSHVSVDPAEELRWLEYAQRLRSHRRAITTSPEAIYVRTARDGARATGRAVGELAIGRRADFLVLDAEHPSIIGPDIETIVDRWITSGRQNCLRDVFIGGEHVVIEGKHPRSDAVAARFRKTMAALLGSM
jgi:formimidoylglutamate deiminase